MKLLKNASENDIQELKQRLKTRQQQRIFERESREVVNIVNKHSILKGVVAR